MLAFVAVTGNGISGHVPRTRRAWPLSSQPDGGLSRLEPERVLQKTQRPSIACLSQVLTKRLVAILIRIHARMHF